MDGLDGTLPLPLVKIASEPPGDSDSSGDKLDEAASDAGQRADALRDEVDRVRAAESAVTTNSWFGPAAFSFQTGARALADDLTTAVTALELMATAYRRLAGHFRHAYSIGVGLQRRAQDLNDSIGQTNNAYEAAKARGLTDEEAGWFLDRATELRAESEQLARDDARALELAEGARAEATKAFDRVTAMAPSLQRRRALQQAAAAAAHDEDAEPGGPLGVLHDVAKPFRWAGDKGEDLGRGVWNGVAEPVAMIVDLVNPMDADGFVTDWSNLGAGVWHGVTHPADFAKAVAGVETWREEGVAYWLGSIVPEAAVAFVSGGGSVALKGSSSAAKITRGMDSVADAARAADKADDAAGAAARTSKADDAGAPPRPDEVADSTRSPVLETTDEVARPVNGSDDPLTPTAARDGDAVAAGGDDEASSADDGSMVERRVTSDDLDQWIDKRVVEDRASAAEREVYVDDLKREVEENFVDGAATLRSGRLDEDLVVAQVVRDGEGGTMKYWTSQDELRAAIDHEKLMDRLALIPEWGERVAVREARIPKGTDITFLHGRVKEQHSEGLRRDFLGGGEQWRFLDFDPDWIVSKRPLP
ncbi:MAG: hypothetical protein M3323_12495 [Actinomycetota bacterium]|nr:hypothetical protein [Actinomycetota bacterium]